MYVCRKKNGEEKEKKKEKKKNSVKCCRPAYIHTYIHRLDIDRPITEREEREGEKIADCTLLLNGQTKQTEQARVYIVSASRFKHFVKNSIELDFERNSSLSFFRRSK